jgi:hypothetical protein
LKGIQTLQRRLQVKLARDWSLLPVGSHQGGPAQHSVVIAPRRLPTIDYYVADLLGSGVQNHRLILDDETSPGSEAVLLAELPPQTRVVLVRMPSERWARPLAVAKDKLVEVVWLLDDDVLAAREDKWLPEAYRLRLLTSYLRFKRAYADLIDRVWASTPAIAARFPAERVEVRPPQAIRLPQARPVTIFYHGTAAHRREHAFLLPIFEELQARTERTVLEVIGDHELYRLFRSVPRLRVLHPMRWPDYLAHLRSGRYDIGLAPLLDTPFNRARSGIKALEIASIGAQGVLSRRPPYTEYAHLPGLHLVGDDPAEWVRTIMGLTSHDGAK